MDEASSQGLGTKVMSYLKENPKSAQCPVSLFPHSLPLHLIENLGVSLKLKLFLLA